MFDAVKSAANLRYFAFAVPGVDGSSAAQSVVSVGKDEFVNLIDAWDSRGYSPEVVEG